MKFYYIYFVAFLFICQSTLGQALSGTYAIPGTVNGNSVNNLTQLANLLNSATVNGTAVFEFSSSYAGGETFPIIFNQFSGAGNVIIRPAGSVSSALSTSGSPGSNALIDLSGVKKISFDGRPGGTGNTAKWQFQNTASGGSYPVFRFINGAAHDTLEYLTIQASGTNTTANVLFGTSTVAGGNSYNTVQYCTIGPYSSYPYNVILASGTGANPNSNNTISNNNIYNYQGYFDNPYAGINITSTGNGSNWNISGNSFYATASIGSYWLTAIYFVPGSSSTGNVITGNYIGGRAPNCGTAGTPWNFPGYRGYTTITDFQGIYVNAGGTTNITNNVIQNIKLTNSTSGSQTFCGISVGGGNAVISNNTIGSPTVAGSIVAGSAGVVLGVWDQTTGSVTINADTIANLTSDFSNAPSTTTPADICGIYAYTSSAVIGACTITNNSVFNLTTANNYNFNQYFYMNAPGGGVNSPNLISNSTVLAGIYLQTTASSVTHTISKNNVYGLHSTLTGGTNRSQIAGIMDNVYGSGSTTNINGNLIYGLWAPDNYGSSGTYYPLLTGIYIGSNQTGVHRLTNNIVDIGYKSSDGSTVKNAYITGIWDNTDYNNIGLKIYCYHNSVYIGGSDNTALNSYAFGRLLSYGSSVYDSLIFKNNIFVNNRTTSSTGKQYGIYLNSTIDVAANYNDIYGTAANFEFGDVGGTDYNTLAAYKSSNAGFETNSISADPQFVSPTTAIPDLHITNTPSISPIDQAGTATATLTYDFDSIVRANYTPVDIGATIDCSTSSSASVTLSVSQDTVCQGTAIVFTAHPTNGGSSPNYNFFLNGSSVQNSSSATYQNTLNNNDSVKVVMTSNSICASPATATSNSITVTVTNTLFVPSVTLTPSQNNICSGAPVTFTAVPTNGGSAPVYNFYVNGTSVQNDTASTYSNSSLNNADSVWVVMTSNAACVSPTTASSSKVYMVITPTVTPSVSISSSQNGVCPGTQIDFTAQPENGGNAPNYNFYVNGSSVQNGNSTTYSNSNLNNHDSVWVVITSDAACVTTTTATSNKVHIVITPDTVLSVNIASSVNDICYGTPITFTANVVSGSGVSTYNFFVNGVSVQNTSANTFLSSSLNNHDSVWVNVSSSALCTTPTATSSHIDMIINHGDSVTQNVNICSNGSYFFHNQNLTSPGTYFDTLTTVHGCDSLITLNLSVSSLLTSQIIDSICGGSAYNFNGHFIDSAGTYTDTLMATGGCDSVVTLVLYVHNIAVPGIGLIGNDTLVLSGFASYQWLLNDTAVNGAISHIYIASQNGMYSVAVTDSFGCSDTSLPISLLHLSVNDIADNVKVSLYPNPTSDNFYLNVEGLNQGKLTVSLFDIEGRPMFTNFAEVNTNRYSQLIDMSGYASGIYFLRIESGSLNLVRRVELIK